MANIVKPTASINTPAIASAATALAANTSRQGWFLQNLGTNALFVLLGTGASTTVFHTILEPGIGNDDGKGAAVSQTEGVVFTGAITIAGTSPRYTVTEM